MITDDKKNTNNAKYLIQTILNESELYFHRGKFPKLFTEYSNEKDPGSFNLKTLLTYTIFQPFKIIFYYILILICIQVDFMLLLAKNQDIDWELYVESANFIFNEIYIFNQPFNESILFTTITGLVAIYVLAKDPLPDKNSSTEMNNDDRIRITSLIDFLKIFQVIFALYLVTAFIKYHLLDGGEYLYLTFIAWIILILSGYQTATFYYLKSRRIEISERIYFSSLQLSHDSKILKTENKEEINRTFEKYFNPQNKINDWWHGVKISKILKVALIISTQQTLLSCMASIILNFFTGQKSISIATLNLFLWIIINFIFISYRIRQKRQGNYFFSKITFPLIYIINQLLFITYPISYISSQKYTQTDEVLNFTILFILFILLILNIWVFYFNFGKYFRKVYSEYNLINLSFCIISIRQMEKLNNLYPNTSNSESNEYKFQHMITRTYRNHNFPRASRPAIRRKER